VKYRNEENKEDVTMEMYYDTLYVRIAKERQLLISEKV
jgi:hypothetical protein